MNRTAEVIEQRKQLPIYSEEAQILEAIEENDILIVAGETGSGLNHLFSDNSCLF